MGVGEAIRRLRHEQGLTLSELSRMAEVSKGYLSEVEANSATRPSAGTLHRIAKALGTSVGELLGGAAGSGATPEPDIPESLREFATETGLPPADVRMLAGIRYRGKAPKTVDDWRYIYESIRLRTQGR